MNKNFGVSEEISRAKTTALSKEIAKVNEFISNKSAIAEKAKKYNHEYARYLDRQKKANKKPTEKTEWIANKIMMEPEVTGMKLDNTEASFGIYEHKNGFLVEASKKAADAKVRASLGVEFDPDVDRENKLTKELDTGLTAEEAVFNVICLILDDASAVVKKDRSEYPTTNKDGTPFNNSKEMTRAAQAAGKDGVYYTKYPELLSLAKQAKKIEDDITAENEDLNKIRKEIKVKREQLKNERKGKNREHMIASYENDIEDLENECKEVEADIKERGKALAKALLHKEAEPVNVEISNNMFSDLQKRVMRVNNFALTGHFSDCDCPDCEEDFCGDTEVPVEDEEYFCEECGSELHVGQHFCSECGKKLD